GEAMSVMGIVGIVVTIVLWGLVAGLALAAAVRSKALFREGAYEGTRDFVVLIPRVLIGVVGSGYLAAVMPPELIATWIGPNSGVIGIVIGMVAGAPTPRGAVVGFSTWAAAMNGCAATPQGMHYKTGRSLYTIPPPPNWRIHL